MSLQTSNKELKPPELKTSKDEASTRDELLRLNNYLENLLQSTKIATIFLDKKENIEWFSPAATDVYNLIASDIGRPLAHLTHRALEMPTLPRLLVLQQEEAVEDEIRLSDGRYFLRRASLYRNHANEVQGTVLTFTDVTELRESDRQARDRLAEIEAVYASAPIGLCVFDKDLRWLRINRYLAEINGHPPQAHIGKTMREILPDLADQAELLRRRVLETGEPLIDFELSGETPAQPGVQRTWVENLYPLRDRAGRIIGVNVVAEEITERKRTEALLQRQADMLQLSHDAIISWRLHGVIEYWNRGAEELYGYSREEALNCATHQLLATQHPKPLVEIEAEMLAQGQWQGELVQRAKDGRRVVVSSRHQLIRESDGTLRILEINRDISDRKQFEQSLREAERLADAANRSKSEFLANISHEIRTPMTAILGYAELLMANSENPDNLESIKIIKRNGHYLLDIVNDILDLFKIEAGKLDIDPQPLSPVELVAEVRLLMEVRAQEKQLPFTVDYENKLPEVIQTDPVRMRQILINLLSNAIKFTEQGYVKLRIRYDDSDEDQPPRLQFNVEDTGIGMSPEQQQTLFQPFAQVDNTDSRRYGGTGLGLNISQRLAQMLGGNISVRSAPQQGSTFTLTIVANPSTEVALIEPPLEINSNSSSPAIAYELRHCRILVADDREDIRYLAQHFIEQAGAKVSTAENGQAAIDAVQQAEAQGKPFDVIVMDMHMPILDGFQATATLRAKGFKQPIIALTAGVMQDAQKRCLEAGCDDFAGKPIESRQLIEIIARHVKPTPTDKLVDKNHTTSTNEALTAQTNPATDSEPRCRVLLVDDSEDSCAALKRLLSMMHCDVWIASDGHSALRKAQEFQPDAVILDVNLPDISGYQVAEHLRQNDELAQIVLIALSGSAADEQDLQAAGFDHYVLKPAGLNELLPLLPLE